MPSEGRKLTPRDFTMKYKGVNPLTKLRDGEPYFFLRAQDKLSGETLSAYADLLKRESEKAYQRGEEEVSNRLLKQSLGIFNVCEIFSNWQDENRQFVKLPD